jgi:hypothetical protein
MANLVSFTTTATAAGTTVLTNTSTYYQIFTGTTTQTVTLPVTSTLIQGWSYHIVNNSTGNLTVNSSGGNLVIVVLPGTTAMVTCILTSGTTAASWEAGYTDFSTATGTGSVVLATSPTLVTPALGAATAASLGLTNGNLTAIKTATFNSQTTIATTSGAITVDWTTAQNQRQTEPTGTITYTFTAPPGPCHLQLLIDSDGTSTAQTINFPGSVVFLGAAWVGVNNKKSIINFWYDGSSYFAIGSNQV